MPTEQELAVFEREFGVRPHDGPGDLAGVHADMERTIVRNELGDLRYRLERARMKPEADARTVVMLEEEILRKEAAARVCGRL